MFERLQSLSQVFFILSHHHHLIHVPGVKEFLASKKIEKDTTYAENITLFIEFLIVQNLWRNISHSSCLQVVFVPTVNFSLLDRNTVVAEEN